MFQFPLLFFVRNTWSNSFLWMNCQRLKIFLYLLLTFRLTKRSYFNLTPRHPLNAFFSFMQKQFRLKMESNQHSPSCSRTHYLLCYIVKKVNAETGFEPITFRS